MEETLIEKLKQAALESQKKARPCLEPAKFNRTIREYQHLFGFEMRKILRRILENQGGQIIILDVMCGGGNVVKELNNEYGINAFGVDIKYYPEFRNNPLNDRFIVTPAQDLSTIPSDCIDLVLNCIGFLDYAEEEWPTAFSESLRVLKPGGELYTCPDYEKYHFWLEQYQRETDSLLDYSSNTRLSWHRFPPVRMSPVLHIINQK